ncbi:MAG TPA: hypothetical protein PKY30_04250 [Myxococcota bacterium]|nr:hypothetical protein [Myxococcota bacterium]HNH46220.1 hypothetical protein [Myxococcota bacterium]
MSVALLLSLAFAQSEPPPPESAPPEPAAAETAPTPPAEAAAPRPPATRIGQGLMGVGLSSNGARGLHLNYGGWSVPGRAAEGPSRGGLGLGWHNIGHLGMTPDGDLRFATGFGYDLVVVPWAGGVVKPWATGGPALQIGMDLGSIGQGIDFVLSLDVYAATGIDILIGRYRRGGLSLGVGLHQPLIQLATWHGNRNSSLATFTLGLRLPTRGRGLMDKLAQRLPSF